MNSHLYSFLWPLSGIHFECPIVKYSPVPITSNAQIRVMGSNFHEFNKNNALFKSNRSHIFRNLIKITLFLRVTEVPFSYFKIIVTLQTIVTRYTFSPNKNKRYSAVSFKSDILFSPCEKIELGIDYLTYGVRNYRVHPEGWLDPQCLRVEYLC